MAKEVGRQELYELVWSKPMKTLAAAFDISDVGLKKACARAEIPTPDRGYWAKRDAGKQTVQRKLSERPPGMSDRVTLGGGNDYGYYRTTDEEVRGPLPAQPEFPESLDAVRERIVVAVGTVKVPRQVKYWHPAIAKVLQEDERRREQQRTALYHSSWNAPQFDSLIERRRLRILNALFLAVGKMHGKASFISYEPRNVHLSFYQQHVAIALEPQAATRSRSTTKQSGSNEATLVLSIRGSTNSKEEVTAWQDNEAHTLEALMTEIAVEIILSAERSYREHELHRYEWRVKRRAELEEADRQRRIAAEKAAQERQRKIEQARVDGLLNDAAAFQKAQAIRMYVETLRDHYTANALASSEEFDQWSLWALAQADRIDPSIGGAFARGMREEEISSLQFGDPKSDCGFRIR